jgi:hypothetical protein
MIGKDWYEWETEEAFDAWHESKIDELNLPAPSANQATGEIDTTAQKTLAYTTGHAVSGKVIAIVEDEHAAGLTKTELRLPEPEFHVEANA